MVLLLEWVHGILISEANERETNKNGHREDEWTIEILRGISSET